jgi:signal transduction histidine kinase
MLPVRRVLERRPVVIAAAAAWSAAVFALFEVVADPTGAITLLYAVPVALVALELGMVAGLASATLATALVVTSWLVAHETIDLVAMLTRSLVLFAIGAIAGRFSDRMRGAHERQRLLLRSGLTLTQLGGWEQLSAAIAAEARRLLGTESVRVEVFGEEPLCREPERMGRGEQVFELDACGIRYGILAVPRSRRLSEDDRTALSILALQAAVAAENAQVLALERDRASVQAELSEVRSRLAERADQLRELVGRQEAERDHVAFELHEQAAQLLAAVMVGLATFDRQVKMGATPVSLDQLRTDLGAALRSLRGLAKSLKPSVLKLGLPAALEQLAATADANGPPMTVAVNGTEGLDPETSTLVYRAVEEALGAVPAADTVSLSTRAAATELVIELRAHGAAIDADRLGILRARVELLGGTLHAERELLRAVIPLPHVLLQA